MLATSAQGALLAVAAAPPPTIVAAAKARGDQAAHLDFAAPWMQPLKKALNHGGTRRAKRDRSDARRKQLQLATVDTRSGRPCVRTIVFRGFLPAHHLADAAGSAKVRGGESCLLTFVTDSRSEKVRHVREALAAGHEAHVECCWWLDEANVQFRISGHAVLATATDESARRAAVEEVWERLGASTRGTFAWADPGAPVVDMPQKASANREPPELADANFVLFIVVPHTVDELRLGGQQKRFRYRAATGDADGAGGGSDDDNANFAGPQSPRGDVLASPGAWTVEEINP